MKMKDELIEFCTFSFAITVINWLSLVVAPFG